MSEYIPLGSIGSSSDDSESVIFQPQGVVRRVITKNPVYTSNQSISSIPSTASTSTNGSNLNVFTRTGGYRPVKTHPGVGANRAAVGRVGGLAIGTSGAHLETFAAQAGAGIGQLITEAINKKSLEERAKQQAIEQEKQLSLQELQDIDKRNKENYEKSIREELNNLLTNKESWTQEYIDRFPQEYQYWLDEQKLHEEAVKEFHSKNPSTLIEPEEVTFPPNTGDVHIAPGIVLPFSNNIGPGNTPQKPKTSADEVAYDHDINYQNAKTAQDIRNADLKSIGDFAQVAINDKNPISQIQGLIGAAGIGIKSAVESIIGVKYGKNETPTF